VPKYLPSLKYSFNPIVLPLDKIATSNGFATDLIF